MTHQFINPASIAAPVGYTHVVEAAGNRMIFISGQVALDPSGNIVGTGDMRAQAQQVFENLKAALAAVGGDFSHVVKFTYFLTDISQIVAVREVRNQHINPQQPPASTAVQVSALFRPELLIEVEAIAVLP